MRIVYVIEQPFDERNYQRFGIQAWLDSGAAVEVWNIMPLSAPRAWSALPAGIRTKQLFVGSHVVAAPEHLTQRLRALGTVDYYVDFVGDSRWGVRTKQRLARHGAIRIVGDLGSMPDLTETPARGIRPLIRKITGPGIRGWATRIETKLNMLYVSRRLPAGVVIVSGELSKRLMRQFRPRPFEIRAHSFDYDVYLRLLSEPRPIIREPYAVFLDQDICFHPEYAFENLNPYVTPERYFPALRAGFGAISKGLGLSVRVAAHPRSTYGSRAAEFFGDALLEQNKTAELIRDATLVMGHSSTALQLAILFGKPLVITTTDQLERSSLGAYIATVAERFGRRVINLDCDASLVDWRAEMRVDQEKYEAYKRTFVKTEDSPDKPLWEIVIDNLEALEAKRARRDERSDDGPSWGWRGRRESLSSHE